MTTRTKSIERLEQKMEDMDRDSLRYHILENAKMFKTSWIELGQALYSVWKNKMYRDWGYMTFDAYTSKEIGIKKQTDFPGKHVVVGVYTGGSVIGELCLLTDNPRTVSADVIESVDMVVLHSKKFEALIEKFPMIGLSLLRHIFLCTSKRLTKSYDRIATIF